jgi:hypothetical protein
MCFTHSAGQSARRAAGASSTAEMDPARGNGPFQMRQAIGQPVNLPFAPMLEFLDLIAELGNPKLQRVHIRCQVVKLVRQVESVYPRFHGGLSFSELIRQVF